MSRHNSACLISSGLIGSALAGLTEHSPVREILHQVIDAFNPTEGLRKADAPCCFISDAALTGSSWFWSGSLRLNWALHIGCPGPTASRLAFGNLFLDSDIPGRLPDCKPVREPFVTTRDLSPFQVEFCPDRHKPGAACPLAVLSLSATSAE